MARAHRENSVFAASQHNPRINRILDHRMLSFRRHYSKGVNIETGPGLLYYSIPGD